MSSKATPESYPELLRTLDKDIKGAMRRLNVHVNAREDFAQDVRRVLLEKVLPKWDPAAGQLSTFAAKWIGGTIKNRLKKDRQRKATGSPVLGVAVSRPAAVLDDREEGAPAEDSATYEEDAQETKFRPYFEVLRQEKAEREAEKHTAQFVRLLRILWLRGVPKINPRTGKPVPAAIVESCPGLDDRNAAKAGYLQCEGRTVPEIMQALGRSQASVYRDLAAAEAHLAAMPDYLREAMREMPGHWAEVSLQQCRREEREKLEATDRLGKPDWAHVWPFKPSMRSAARPVSTEVASYIARRDMERAPKTEFDELNALISEAIKK